MDLSPQAGRRRAVSGQVTGQHLQAHVPVGRQWFERMTEAYTALWWIPRGTVPGTADAESRVRRLRAHGPTADAFTLRVLFPPPGDGLARAGQQDWACPV